MYEVSFSVINNLGTASSELQINFGVLRIDTKNSAPGSYRILEQISNYDTKDSISKKRISFESKLR